MLELIFQGFAEWAYELVLECWEYFSTALLDIMSMDYAYMKSHVPVMDDIIQVLMAVGWALLIGNLVFQALKSMMSGLGFLPEALFFPFSCWQARRSARSGLALPQGSLTCCKSRPLFM